MSGGVKSGEPETGQVLSAVENGVSVLFLQNNTVRDFASLKRLIFSDFFVPS
jgi:hypothetical protein